MSISLRIFDEDILELLQRQLTFWYGKMSSVFEYVNGEPIGAIRMFAPKVDNITGKNLCQWMIDCDLNPTAKKTCKDSDASAAKESASKLKKILYRCHGGKGFVNLAIPIKIWETIVILNLYMGQCLLKIRNEEYKKFVEELQKRDICVLTGQKTTDVVRDLTDSEISAFYHDVVSVDLQPTFRLADFRDQFKKQQENGMTLAEFFNAVDLLDKLANHLSELGNKLYTLKAYVDLTRRLPNSLMAQCQLNLKRLADDIQTLILDRKEALTVEKRTEAVDNFHRESLKILLLLKDYETGYVHSLLKPYLEHALTLTDNAKQLVLQFFLLRACYEVQRYPVIREIAEKHKMSKYYNLGDGLLEKFFKLVEEIGDYGGLSQKLAAEEIIKLYKKAPFMLQSDRLVSILMYIYKNDRNEIEKILKEQRIYRIVAHDLQTADRKEVTEYRFPLHLIIEDAEYIWKYLMTINAEISKKSREEAEPDIEEVRNYVDRIMSLRDDTISLWSFDSDPKFDWALANRRRIDLRYDRVFLNSGGLGPTSRDVLDAQNWWIAERNEEGPVGLELEKTLTSKIEDVRKSTTKLIGAKSLNEIAFTHGTTEGIQFILDSIPFKPNDEVIFTDLEFDSIEKLRRILDRKYSVLTTTANILECNNDSSKIVERIVDKITLRTRLIIVSHVTYSTGSELPIKEIINRSRKKHEELKKRQPGLNSSELLVLVDGAQAIGNIPVNVIDHDCDFYAFDGHKWLLGPEESGALYVRDFLRKINEGNYHFPVIKAYMVSKDCQCALNLRNRENNDLELATADAAKIIGFGKAVELFRTNKPMNVAERKRRLINKFLENINGNPYFSILNAQHALNTGILCLKVKGREKPEEYRELVEKLQRLNIYVRYIKRPACLRISFHYTFNSATDIDVLTGALKLLVEGSNIHRAEQKKVIKHIEDLVKEYFTGGYEPGRKIGLLIYGPSGIGKSRKIEEILENLENDKTINYWVKVVPKKIFIGTSDEQRARFTSVLINARKKSPSVVFFDEADSLLANGSKEALVGDFKTQHDEIIEKREKVFFIGAVNEVLNISEDVRERRLRTAYFPLPSFETRLEFLFNRSRETKRTGGNVSFERITEATDGYSMEDMNKLWAEADHMAKDSPLRQSHFERALERTKPTNDDKKIKEYDAIIKKLGSIVLSQRDRTGM